MSPFKAPTSVLLPLRLLAGFLIGLAPVIAAPGDLDATFGGSTGKVTIPMGFGNSLGNAVATQSDGKIVVVGSGADVNGINGMAVLRLNADGSLETTFNATGKLLKRIGSEGDYVSTVALQSDGKILVAGGAQTNGTVSMVVLRLNADGSPDTSFNGTGTVTTSSRGSASALAIQTDGKIVVLDSAFVLIRFNVNGTVDTGFSHGALPSGAQGNLNVGRALALQGDGKIIAVGNSNWTSGGSQCLIVRFNANGTLDNSFTNNLLFPGDINLSGRAYDAVAVQADGNIVAAGWAPKGQDSILVQRFTPANGSLDPTFGSGGTVMTTYSGRATYAQAMRLESDGKILLAGWADSLSYETDPQHTNQDFLLARLNSNGTPDSTVGASSLGGAVMIPVGLGDDYGLGMAVQQDGRIIVVGETTFSSSYACAVVRLCGDATTLPVTEVTATSATLNGSVNANGLNTTVTFDYGLTSSYGSSATATQSPLDGGGSVSVTAPLSGLSTATAYHYRVQATNSAGTYVGSDLVFTTADIHASNANLASLTLNPGALAPAFTPANTSYTALVSHDTASVTVTATPTDPLAAMTINNTPVPNGGASNPIPLSFGPNSITITVTAQDSSQKTYTLTVIRYASPLDPAFGSGGLVQTVIGNVPYGVGLAQQNDGKYLVAGGKYVARYNPDGSLDPTFNGTGMVSPQAGLECVAEGVAVQSDGKILVGTAANIGFTYYFTLFRFTSSGGLDSSFADHGAAVTTYRQSYESEIRLVVQPDGKILAGASSALLRFNSNGTPDTSFNGNGQAAILGGSDGDYSIFALQSDGKICLATNDSLVQTLLARYNANGTLDTSFNGTGTVVIRVGNTTTGVLSNNVPADIAIQGDGKILVAESVSFDSQNQSQDFAVLRFNANGTLDSTFNNSGVCYADWQTALGYNSSATAMALQNDGKILVGGIVGLPSGDRQFALVAFNPDGSLNPQLNGTGRVITTFGDGNDLVSCLALQGDGKVFLAGTSSGGSFALARYLPLAAVPLLTGGTADHLGGASATLHAQICPNGSSASAGFIYGTDPTLTTGTTSTLIQNLGSGSAYVVLGQALNGLTPQTIYYYRTSAQNSQGAVQSPILSFTTTTYTAPENWRLQYFGTANNTGSAADDATPQKDGVSNFVKFATGLNPSQPGAMPGVTGTSGTNLTFTYTPSAAAVAAGVTFTVEYSDTLPPHPWKSDIVNQGVIGSGGSPVTATVPAPEGANAQRFLHLKITSP